MSRTGGYAYRRNREALIKRGDTRCAICGLKVDVTVKAPDPMSPSADHIVAWSDGGTDKLSNLRLVHLRCNSSRGRRDTSRIIKSSGTLQ